MKIRVSTQQQENKDRKPAGASYPESVSTLATGCNSSLAFGPFRPRSQSSRLVSFEKFASTAPTRVPVAINGEEVPGDQAKLAVRGISLRRTIVGKFGTR